jgi:hypothetical protein
MVWPSHTAVCSIFDPFSTADPNRQTSSTHKPTQTRSNQQTLSKREMSKRERFDKEKKNLEVGALD